MTDQPRFRHFTLELRPEGITLHGNAGGSDWRALARAPVDPETVHADLRRLRVAHAGGQRGPLSVEIWLPEEEVAIRAIDSGTVPPASAMIAHAFRDAAPGGAEELVFDGPGVLLGDVHIVAGVRRSVLEETIGFLAPAGFAVTGFTLAATPVGLEHTPWFAVPGKEQSPGRWRIGWPWKRGAVAAAALAFGALLAISGPAMARLPGTPAAAETASAPGAVEVAELRTSPRPVLRSPIEAIPPATLGSATPPAAAAAVAPATPVMAQDGSVRVIAARPDIVPPLRPRPAATAAAAAAVAPPVATMAPDGTLQVIAAQPDIVPPLRDTPAPPATMAQDGSVRVIAARPDIVPPLRPAPPVSAIAAQATAALDALVVEAAEDLSPSVNALTRSDRPRARPMTAPPADAVEVAALTPSALALSLSDAPMPRPSGFVRPSAPAPAAAPAATPAATAPDPAPAAKPKAAPPLPTSASVARAATIEGALPMRQIVLIGVYGKSGNRSALVRLPNGRYQKVRQGDRVDGAEVAAISNDAVRLRRGGRDTVLVIPQ